MFESCIVTRRGLKSSNYIDSYAGWVQNLLTTQEEIFIPFVWRMCGKCCKKASVDPDYFNPFEIADYLNHTVREVVQTYLGKIVSIDSKNVKWKQTKPRKPCAFLEGNKCKIYPIRPGPCRSFPIFTDFGDHHIGCSGRLEYVRARKKLGRGIPYFVEPYTGEKPPIVRIVPNRWRRTLEKYSLIKPSEDSIKLFIQVNTPRKWYAKICKSCACKLKHRKFLNLQFNLISRNSRFSRGLEI